MLATGAGNSASFSDADYEEAGAEIWDRDRVWRESDLILKVTPPSIEEVQKIPSGGKIMSFLWPKDNPELVEALREGNVTSIAMDCVPRISRAQKLDALSSMSNISGYRAVIEAAYHYGSFFSAQFTAAGRIDQAKVFIIGAGVAGLAAIGAARGLGAHVMAFDVRAAAREQVESMGAEFVEVQFEESGEGEGGYAKVMSQEFIDAEMALFRSLAPEVDIVITTALIPGRPAPKLWRSDALELMKPGSVVVDLAAERGGNCDATVPDEIVDCGGVKVLGWLDLPSRLAPTASQLYGMNLVHYLKDIESGEGEVDFDMSDVVVRSSIVTHDGELHWPPPPLSELDPSSLPKEMQKAAQKDDEKPTEAAEKPAAPAPAPAPKPAPAARSTSSTPEPTGSMGKKQIMLVAFALVWCLLLIKAEPSDVSESTKTFLNHLTVFALSCFIGWQVIWNVSHALHTPLMSVTNAISGIILVGGMLQAHGGVYNSSSILGGLAVLLAMINVVGGFAVTHRMLKMFRK
jgi:NAD(P) transhydrogenase subunit alpha